MPAADTLPSQGGSDGTWGTELNAWLQFEHASDGTHSTMLTYEGEILVYEGDILTWQE
ncbi:MAG: hypothetical protein HWN68_10020 [Desulfobacterales bacterium]|nr:hypothetical protein [Desulfobacterales bacterium]